MILRGEVAFNLFGNWPFNQCSHFNQNVMNNSTEETIYSELAVFGEVTHNSS